MIVYAIKSLDGNYYNSERYSVESLVSAEFWASKLVASHCFPYTGPLSENRGAKIVTVEMRELKNV